LDELLFGVMTEVGQAGMSTRRKLGESKQAHRVIHQPVSVVSQCSLNAWLRFKLAINVYLMFTSG